MKRFCLVILALLTISSLYSGEETSVVPDVTQETIKVSFSVKEVKFYPPSKNNPISKLEVMVRWKIIQCPRALRYLVGSLTFEDKEENWGKTDDCPLVVIPLKKTGYCVEGDEGVVKEFVTIDLNNRTPDIIWMSAEKMNQRYNILFNLGEFRTEDSINVAALKKKKDEARALLEAEKNKPQSKKSFCFVTKSGEQYTAKSYLKNDDGDFVLILLTGERKVISKYDVKSQYTSSYVPKK